MEPPFIEDTSNVPPCGAQHLFSLDDLVDDPPAVQECVIIKGFSLQKKSADDNFGFIIIHY